MATKRALFFCFIFLGVVLAGGCETTKGIAGGVGATVQGAAKDTENLWQAIVKADSWIKKNLW